MQKIEREARMWLKSKRKSSRSLCGRPVKVTGDARLLRNITPGGHFVVTGDRLPIEMHGRVAYLGDMAMQVDRIVVVDLAFPSSHVLIRECFRRYRPMIGIAPKEDWPVPNEIRNWGCVVTPDGYSHLELIEAVSSIIDIAYARETGYSNMLARMIPHRKLFIDRTAVDRGLPKWLNGLLDKVRVFHDMRTIKRFK